MPVFAELTQKLGRDFWFGGAKDASSMEDRYMPPVRLYNLDDDAAVVTFKCDKMIAHSALKFVLVEEVLDFMRQMLNVSQNLL